jgi:ABC-type transport system involved in cytochrome c biogenesis permease subunit
VGVLLNAGVVLLPLLYLLVTLDYGVLFFAGLPASRRTASPALRATLLLHLLWLVGIGVHWHQLPIATVPQALSVLAFAVAAVYAVVEWRGRERSTGLWLVGLVFVFQLLSSLLMRPDTVQRELFHNPLFGGHVLLALLGYAAFAVAAAYGFLFLVLYRELKRGSFSVFYGKLPPLQVLDRMMSVALVLGFLALTGAAVLGAVWAHQLYREEWLRDPKIVATFATWALYGAALLLRRLRRWQGRQTALASLTGLGAILFSLFAVNFWLSGFHGFR